MIILSIELPAILFQMLLHVCRLFQSKISRNFPCRITDYYLTQTLSRSGTSNSFRFLQYIAWYTGLRTRGGLICAYLTQLTRRQTGTGRGARLTLFCEIATVYRYVICIQLMTVVRTYTNLSQNLNFCCNGFIQTITPTTLENHLYTPHEHEGLQT